MKQVAGDNGFHNTNRFNCGIDLRPTSAVGSIKRWRGFDVEAVFLFPWAVAFGQLGLFALVEMIIFIGILIFGLYYAWKKGVLKWV